MKSASLGPSLALAAIALLWAPAANAAEIKVMISGGYAPAYEELVPQFQKATGHTVVTAYGPSMGETPQAIPNRIARGEAVDVIIGVATALDGMIAKGTVASGSRAELAQVLIYTAVRAGTPKPDIGTTAAFRQALLSAKSIAYSDSASGTYIATEMFKHLGIEDQVKGKSRMIPAEPVGKVIARGEAEIGFQPLSALRPVPGIELVGPMPPEVQRPTIYVAGIAATAKEPAAAKALVAFLMSPAATEAVRKSGMDPMAAR